MKNKNIIARLKQLEDKVPNLERLTEQRYEEAAKKVLEQATTEELRIASMSDKYRDISEEESLEMLEILSERVRLVIQQR
ncbi:hypothetical protein [Carnobacterium mobile]|uniref:hypothetical protein n=1 Tax=Carnobacterium mobile TaxID=2750 RepID=UPI00054D3AC5|nr:hypothetical protein [Carnobacterium mobile]